MGVLQPHMLALAGVVAALSAGCGRIGFGDDRGPGPINLDGGTMQMQANQRLLWINNNSEILSMTADGAELQTVITTEATCLASDPTRRELYWCSPTGIMRAGYDGSNPVLVTPATSARQIAIDPVRARIYWTEYVPGRVASVDLDGNGEVTHESSDGINDVAIPPGTRVYYSDDVGADRVSYFSTDDSEPPGDVFQAAGPAIVNADSIVFDEAGSLFWWDGQSGSKKLQKIEVDGSGAVDVFTDQASLLSPGHLAYDPNLQRLFWSTGATRILRMPKGGGQVEEVPLPPSALVADLIFIDLGP